VNIEAIFNTPVSVRYHDPSTERDVPPDKFGKQVQVVRRAIGFLVHVDEKNISIASDLCENYPQFNEVGQIPRGCVISVTQLVTAKPMTKAMLRKAAQEVGDA
jgi:hypothetical protein